MIVSLLALLGTAQQPEIATHDVPVTFKSRVSSVSVPVVVRDRRGRAVGNRVPTGFSVPSGNDMVRLLVRHSEGKQLAARSASVEVPKFDSGALSLAPYRRAANSVAPVPLTLPVSGLPPGPYTIELRALDSSASEPVVRVADLEVK